MPHNRCIIIPAVKKNAVIPDQLVKKLAGVTLIQRALNTAKALVPDKDIYVVTDSEEISLICVRNGVNYVYDKTLRFQSTNIFQELKGYVEKQSFIYDHLLIYRASSPLVDHRDIQKGYERFVKAHADILVTLRKQEQRLWKELNGSSGQLICDETTDSLLVEIKSFLILRAGALNGECIHPKIVPYYLDEKAVEINSYQDWWICEKLLQQRHIVFVVTGYPAVGLGHIFRALTLAHEITDHRITFLCTTKSELAVRQIAGRDYKTVLQQGPLLDEVLNLEPDLVVNDILNTEEIYVTGLKQKGVKVVNFEDVGPGAKAADLVVNAVYPPEGSLPEHFLCGSDYFCLRDEFLDVGQGRFQKVPQNLLIAFGGTDPRNFTLKALCAVQDICEQRQMKIFIVTGPGYLHRESMEQYLNAIVYQNYEYAHKTGVMSAIMEQADFAISSAGRTVYELAHMRVPAIILSQNEREHTHFFARPEYGFEYLGYMDSFDAEKVVKALHKLLDPVHRKTLHSRMKQFRFGRNKKRVIKRILNLVEEE